MISRTQLLFTGALAVTLIQPALATSVDLTFELTPNNGTICLEGWECEPPQSIGTLVFTLNDAAFENSSNGTSSSTTASLHTPSILDSELATLAPNFAPTHVSKSGSSSVSIYPTEPDASVFARSIDLQYWWQSDNQPETAPDDAYSYENYRYGITLSSYTNNIDPSGSIPQNFADYIALLNQQLGIEGLFRVSMNSSGNTTNCPATPSPSDSDFSISNNARICTADFYGTVGTFPYTATLVSISEVPLPAAAWLFGSALIGLIGIRRKK